MGTSSRAPAATRTTLPLGEHRDGAKLDLEPRWILRQIFLVEANDLRRLFALAGESIGERRGALGNEPRVGTVDESRRGTQVRET